MSQIEESKTQLQGRIALITGGTAGLGKEAAISLARLGATVVLLARSPERGKQAIDEIHTQIEHANVHLLSGDLSSLDSIRTAAKEFQNNYNALHILINNAAVAYSERRETQDGFELHFGVNYLSHYLLTALLLELLKKSAPARIVNVGAKQMGAVLDFDDLQLNQGWSYMKSVTRAKLAMLLWTRELSHRLEGAGVTANILDPGLVKTDYHNTASFLQRTAVRLLGKPPSEAAKTYTYLAASPKLDSINGKLFSGQQEVTLKGQALDDKIAKRLWEVSASLVKISA